MDHEPHSDSIVDGLIHQSVTRPSQATGLRPAPLASESNSVIVTSLSASFDAADDGSGPRRLGLRHDVAFGLDSLRGASSWHSALADCSPQRCTVP